MRAAPEAHRDLVANGYFLDPGVGGGQTRYLFCLQMAGRCARLDAFGPLRLAHHLETHLDSCILSAVAEEK